MPPDMMTMDQLIAECSEAPTECSEAPDAQQAERTRPAPRLRRRPPPSALKLQLMRELDACSRVFRNRLCLRLDEDRFGAGTAQYLEEHLIRGRGRDYRRVSFSEDNEVYYLLREAADVPLVFAAVAHAAALAGCA